MAGVHETKFFFKSLVLLGNGDEIGHQSRSRERLHLSMNWFLTESFQGTLWGYCHSAKSGPLLMFVLSSGQKVKSPSYLCASPSPPRRRRRPLAPSPLAARSSRRPVYLQAAQWQRHRKSERYRENKKALELNFNATLI